MLSFFIYFSGIVLLFNRRFSTADSESGINGSFIYGLPSDWQKAGYLEYPFCCRTGYPDFNANLNL